MSLLGDVARWFADPEHWQGPHGIPERILEHLVLSGLAVAWRSSSRCRSRSTSATPAAAASSRSTSPTSAARCRRWRLLALGSVIAIALGLGLGFWPTIFALVPLAIPPIMTNTYVAVREVDRDMVEAARGMGSAEGQILRRSRSARPAAHARRDPHRGRKHGRHGDARRAGGGRGARPLHRRRPGASGVRSAVRRSACWSRCWRSLRRLRSPHWSAPRVRREWLPSAERLRS